MQKQHSEEAYQNRSLTYQLSITHPQVANPSATDASTFSFTSTTTSMQNIE